MGALCDMIGHYWLTVGYPPIDPEREVCGICLVEKVPPGRPAGEGEPARGTAHGTETVGPFA